jgi:hypothetical protein
VGRIGFLTDLGGLPLDFGYSRSSAESYAILTETQITVRPRENRRLVVVCNQAGFERILSGRVGPLSRLGSI